MRYLPHLVTLLAITLGLALGGYALAQDQGTPDAALCATPVGEAEGTPAGVTTAPETAATPGGVEPGTPVGYFPCATPIDSQATSETGSTGDGATAATAVQVEFIDIAFVPDELTIPADTDVTLQFVNNGAAVHNFLIEDPEIFSGDLQPGATSELVVNLPAGTYEYICTVPGHAAAGMVGTLTVE